jgi:RNA polymerase sigma-70 factor (ECF subfamily)
MVSRELIAACRRGDPRAFEEVVRLTYRQVYTQALRVVGDRQDAEDVTQDAYLRVFRGLRGFREEAQFETWLYRIVANAAISHLRRRGRFGDLGADPVEDDVPGTEEPEPAGTVADRDVLLRALDSLPDGLRVVVVLKDVYDLSCRDIADRMGLSEGAVKVRLHRARRKLRDELATTEAGDEM